MNRIYYVAIRAIPIIILFSILVFIVSQANFDFRLILENIISDPILFLLGIIIAAIFSLPFELVLLLIIDFTYKINPIKSPLFKPMVILLPLSLIIGYFTSFQTVTTFLGSTTIFNWGAFLGTILGFGVIRALIFGYFYSEFSKKSEKVKETKTKEKT